MMIRLLLLAFVAFSSAFQASPSFILSRRTIATALFSTVEAPTREKTDRKTGTDKRTGSDTYDGDEDKNWDFPDLEYLVDSAESRELEDPFHILLLGSTFEKPKVTVAYVSGSLVYVLGMPKTEATELSQFAESEGMSCLGTWPREECLSLGKQLQVRDIVCRVVPFVEGGQRGWQAKDASSAKYGESSST
jgi:hypothetical protein